MPQHSSKARALVATGAWLLAASLVPASAWSADIEAGQRAQQAVPVPQAFQLALARVVKVARLPKGFVPTLVAVPGGRSASVRGTGTILVGTQLWQGLHPLDEAEAAAVIAHEVAHLEACDIQRRLCDASALGGMPAALSGGLQAAHAHVASGRDELAILAMRRNHQREFQADARGKELLQRAGYAGTAMARMLMKVSAEGGGDFSGSHPAVEERLANLGLVLQASASMEPPHGLD